MLDQPQVDASIMYSIVSRMNGFMYRCCNDKSYTMLFMEGDVEKLTGHAARCFTGPERRSYSALTHPADLDTVYVAVDGALATRTNWDVHYRIVRPDRTDIWVHEIGGGVWQGNELQYLEGVIVDADKARRSEMQTQTLLDSISKTSRNLVSHTVPISEVLHIMRILALNARLEAGRAGTHGAAFGFVAQELSSLADESASLASAITSVTTELESLLQTGSDLRLGAL